MSQFLDYNLFNKQAEFKLDFFDSTRSDCLSCTPHPPHPHAVNLNFKASKSFSASPPSGQPLH